MAQRRPLLCLCGGLQSSGSTLVSWCFLQRGDMNGVLDAFHDQIFRFPERLDSAYHWCKFTISAFRFADLAEHYRDEGFEIRPLLVLRDPRAVFRSLSGKPYGRNGLTAEDPPLRMRLRRFKADWRMFQENGWPMVRFEDLAAAPEATLRELCGRLDLPWDEAMLRWPKPRERIAFVFNGNDGLMRSLKSNLAQTIRPEAAAVKVDGIPAEDLQWLEEEFREFHQAHGYPLQVAPSDASSLAPGRLLPTREATRRQETEQRLHRLLVERNELADAIGANPIIKPLAWLRLSMRRLFRPANPTRKTAR